MLQEPAYSKFNTQLAYRLAPEWIRTGPSPSNSSEFDSLALNYPNNHVVMIYKNLLTKTQLKIKLHCRNQPIPSLAHNLPTGWRLNGQNWPQPLKLIRIRSLALNYPNNHVLMIYKNLLTKTQLKIKLHCRNQPIPSLADWSQTWIRNQS